MLWPRWSKPNQNPTNNQTFETFCTFCHTLVGILPSAIIQFWVCLSPNVIHMIPQMDFNQNADDGDRGHEEEMCNPLLIRLNGDLSGTTCPTHDDSLAPLPHNQCPTLLNTLSLHFTCVKVRTFGTFPCFPSICKFARPRRTLHCVSV